MSKLRHWWDCQSERHKERLGCLGLFVVLIVVATGIALSNGETDFIPWALFALFMVGFIAWLSGTMEP